MDNTFFQLMAFLLVAGLIFFTDHESPKADAAKMILGIGSCIWLVAHAIVQLAEAFL